MKKLVLGLALASFVISCKKIQAGGNKGAIKMEEGAERYSDDVMTDKPMEMKEAAANVETVSSEKVSEKQDAPAKVDSAKMATPTAATVVTEKK